MDVSRVPFLSRTEVTKIMNIKSFFFSVRERVRKTGVESNNSCSDKRFLGHLCFQIQANKNVLRKQRNGSVDLSCVVVNRIGIYLF